MVAECVYGEGKGDFAQLLIDFYSAILIPYSIPHRHLRKFGDNIINETIRMREVYEKYTCQQNY